MKKSSDDKVAIFLFDRSGKMALPFAEAGWHCLCIDINGNPGTDNFTSGGMIVREVHDIRRWKPHPSWVNADFFAAFPPCDHLAVSGSRWMKGKGLRKLADAIDLFAYSAEWAEWFNCPYIIENPVGTISTYWRKPDHSFNPYDYTAFELGDNYTKKTCLWTGGGFVMPAPKRDPEAGDPDDRIHKAPPGPDRANFRSVTPLGFARAVFEANFGERKAA